ncbi:hypothetical protein N7520_011524 [Penicillium odoratum]|uniref:uncharacterized protein n=1 Tax=Penicillium odoratum TaxID=1167516 RepID=UPI002547169F|nr:uncharacterized protein N7520_011524 [Penicillium odoratum]KAJ5746342.1 hypothetical protein N7520_011524 [Penicillium odoratum]
MASFYGDPVPGGRALTLEDPVSFRFSTHFASRPARFRGGVNSPGADHAKYTVTKNGHAIVSPKDLLSGLYAWSFGALGAARDQPFA